MKTTADLRIPFTWAERRPVILEKFLYIPGHYSEHASWKKIGWSDPSIFGREGRVCIEYCSGNGQWIADRARLFPQMLWVAVEIRFDRARKIWSRIHREQLDNLFVVCGDANQFNRFYAVPDSVEEAFVNFPDPWPKRRHAKQRIVQKDFINDISRIVRKEGKATFVTDDPDCRDNMMREIALCPCWKSEFAAPGYVTEWPNYGDSFFNDLWLGKGKTIYYQNYRHV